MSKRVNMKKLSSMAKAIKATLPLAGGKGAHGEERPAKKVKGICDVSLEVFPRRSHP